MTNLNREKTFHFIAIGGVGMSGLAKYLLEKGYKVSGSDIQLNKYTKNLEKLGAKIFIGHNKANISGTPMIIASTAIRKTNPEFQEAKSKGLEILHRSDLLQMISQEFSDNKDSIFIGFSGTHGKTTTSGLCSYILAKAGYKPSYVVGGTIPDLNDNAAFSSNAFFVAELDESDGTILKYQPDISVINNLETDHVDFYTNGLDDLLDKFTIYIKNLKQNAKILINNDCEGNLKLMEANSRFDFITYGLNNADYTAKNIEYNGLSSKFDIYKDKNKIATIELSIPGKHNVYNALSVFASLCESNVDIEKITEHFKTFTGMGRRFQLNAQFNDIKVIDDYAHHPSEIQATIESARNAIDTRLVAIFQPHRYTRLKGLWNDFLKSFDKADKLIVLDVYAASEDPIKEADSKAFAIQIKHKDAIYVSGSVEEAAAKILPMLKSRDTILTLGAGDITKMGQLLNDEYNKVLN